MRRSHLHALAAAACTAAVLLAGCGGDDGGETTGGGVATAPETARQPPAATAPTTTGAGGGAAVLARGRAAFDEYGCASCHTLAAAGASGAVGPNLDEVLPGRTAAFIRESIVDPDATVASGFSAGVMPSDFGDRIPPAQLTALVAFLRAESGR